MTKPKKQGFQKGNKLAEGVTGGGKVIVGNRNGQGEARKFLTQQLRARLHEPVVALKKLMALTDDDVKDFNGKLIAAHLVDQVLVAALKGDLGAAAFVWDRIEGKPTQKLEGKLTHEWDLSKLSDKELAALEALAHKAHVELELQEDGTYAPPQALPAPAKK